MSNTKNTEREFKEVEGGSYDKFGFYRTPNGSFWDVDGVYFDRTGKDIHGGYYDEEFNYHPGEGWIESLMCYEDEVNDINKINANIGDEEGHYGNDYEDGDYDVYEDINDDLRNPNTKEPSYYDVVENGNKRNKINSYSSGGNKPSNYTNNNDENKIEISKTISGNKSIESKMQVFSKISLKEENTKNANSNEPSQIKKDKEVVAVEKITSDTVQDALTNKKNIVYQGYQVSADLDVSDDDDDSKNKNKKHSNNNKYKK